MPAPNWSNLACSSEPFAGRKRTHVAEPAHTFDIRRIEFEKVPISPREVFVTMGEALRFRLRHDDLTHYNAVQKVLYLGVMAVGVLIVISGLALWKPVQFSELANLFGSFQNIRLVHFLCMTAIMAFIVVHVTLALLVPQSLLAMLTGGPVIDNDEAPSAAGPTVAETKTIPEIKTVPVVETSH